MEQKVSELVWLYIKRRPFIKELVREGIINNSALARKICNEIYGDERKVQAVKMAIIRASKKLKEAQEDLEYRVLSLLKNSSLSIRTKVVVATSSKRLNIDSITYAKSRYYTYVAPESELSKIKKLDVHRIEENLDLIVINSSEEIEETPGVVSLLLRALALEGINVCEIISCYTDTMIVVRQADTAKAYEVLMSLLK